MKCYKNLERCSHGEKKRFLMGFKTSRSSTYAKLFFEMFQHILAQKDNISSFIKRVPPQVSQPFNFRGRGVPGYGVPNQPDMAFLI